MKKIQIGIMGSQADLKYSNECIECAKELGKYIGLSDNILVYGAEKDYSSLSLIAAKECNKYNGITVGITYGTDKKVYEEYTPDIIIPTGLGVGGGREYTLVLSCDVIIAIGGGSGTLNEIAVAYQNNIPIIVINKFDGWAKKLNNKYLDNRKRLKCVGVSSAKDAVDMAIKLGSK